MIEVIKEIFSPLKKLFYSPILRYSHHFKGLSLNVREKMLKIAMEFARASKVDGDYFEFGVYKGETFTAAFFLNKYHGPKEMKFYALDSFDGLPEISGVDAEFPQYREGQYRNSLETFKAMLIQKGVDLERVSIVPGWFKDSLKSFEEHGKVAIAWIDCDLYESAIPVLDFLTSRVTDGTILIFDDWFSFRGDPKKGEQKAFAEWLKKNRHITASEFHKFGWHGNSFILHVK